MRTTGDHHLEGPSMVTTTTAEATAIGGDHVYTIEDLGLRAAPQTQHTFIGPGVFRERAFELIAFVATITIVLVYVIFNYSANQSHNSIKIARLTITCLFAPILIVGGIVFTMRYLRSKNLIFRTVGANAEMQRICEILFAAQSLLKFDVQLAGSSLILWLRKGFRHWDQTDQIVVSIGSIVTIAWISLGLCGLKTSQQFMYF
ncbi:unnamed protein product [Medioppia subpectinata]|uniref:DUF7789 domain-containing protein n=1 Tax=Medioppia subpectinata TaxID=1979941 RepID=A0A7R9Q541_9ACAR|nr:unnamed protein product [Medioppia subpectinata]CAG2113360.1 unnamed protein product [Medioppia subpectinata]